MVDELHTVAAVRVLLRMLLLQHDLLKLVLRKLILFPALFRRLPVSTLINGWGICTVSFLEQVRLLDCSLYLTEIRTLFAIASIILGSLPYVATFTSLLLSRLVSSRWSLLILRLQILHWRELFAACYLTAHRALLTACSLFRTALVLLTLTLLHINSCHTALVILLILLELICANAVEIYLTRVVCLIRSWRNHWVALRGIQRYGMLTWFFRLLVHRPALFSRFLLV